MADHFLDAPNTDTEITRNEATSAPSPLATTSDTGQGDNFLGERQALSLELGECPTARATGTLADRTARPSMPLGYQAGFFLASMVGGLSSVCIKQLLLPIQVGILDPMNTATSFALVASLGALAGLIASPLTGALSDRTTSRWGRRRPWIVFGIVTTVIGLLIMARATTIPWLLFGEILAQIGVDSILSTVTALIPDHVPQEQQAGTAALNGMAPIVGGVIGLVMVTRFTATHLVWQGYLLLAALSVLFVLVFLLVLREQPITQQAVPPFRWRVFFVGFLQPLGSRDFTCTLLSRCLVFLSFTILGAYLFFYLSQGLHLSASVAAQGVTTFQLISTGTLVVSALVASAVTHRLRRLKPVVIVGALLMASGLALIIVFPTWSALLMAAIIFGYGFGGYLGVDITLAVRVLPNTHDCGKDLGLMSTAIFLPLIVSPVIGAFILNMFHSFTVLFTIAAISSILAAVLIVPIKAVQ